MSTTQSQSPTLPRQAVSEPYMDWFDLSPLEADPNAGQPPLAAYRDFLQYAQDEIAARFDSNADIVDLIHARGWIVDQVLIRCWQHLLGDLDATLVAVGGYGRRELLPGSDVDIMLLLGDTEDEQSGPLLEAFLMLLWDIGLEVGHSVRTLQDCVEQSTADITVATNLMEARALCGSQSLFERMRESVGPDNVWPSADFFRAKLEEQQQRYARFDDAVYNLEPNVKEGPGGLRDGQMIAWVLKRHFGSDLVRDLIDEQFITREEYDTLMESQRFLWRVRFGLHRITNRREDRLLFDHQRTLAKLFGYTDRDHILAVEWFMKDYYLAIQALSRLNEMLLQLLEEVILHADDPEEPVAINRRFQSRKGFLEVAYDTVFDHYPFALLEVFLLMQQIPQLTGVSASTIRLVRSHLHLIDDNFRDDIRCRSLFMEIFRQPEGLTRELRRMNRYGILAAYYPPFEKIVGQMQHDLFHAYTVDEHTLFVIRNLRRFFVKEHANELPHCSRVTKNIPKPELLYLAGFFHDIAKGRGGNHAELGAIDAREFLAHHDVSEYDQELVAWLVESHLLMSHVAQRRDISDPDEIHEFATRVGDRTRLNYLYLLTVADIRGTNPTLWNAWKDSLFRELYNNTRDALRRGLENPLHREQLISDIKSTALGRLAGKGVDPDRLEALWENFPDDYFLRQHVDEVMWHAETILKPGNSEHIRVEFKAQSERGGSALFIYTPVVEQLFIRTTGLLDQLGLSIAEARIFTTADDYAVDTYQLLDANGEPLTGHYQAEELTTLMQELLTSGEVTSSGTRPPARRLRQFQVDTKVRFYDDDAAGRSIVELITSDNPGLLSQVGQVFHAQGVNLQNAKVATFGSQAEDVFHVTNRDNLPLTEAEQNSLRDQLIETLNTDY